MSRFSLIIPAIMLASGCASEPGYDYETVVKRELRDPDSAQFTDVTVNVESACGFVNGKNGFGGYGGRQPFVAVGDSVTLIEGGSADESELVTARCLEPSRSLMNKWMTEAIIEQLKASR